MRSESSTPPGSRSTVAPSSRARPAISVVLPAPSRPSTVISIALECDNAGRAAPSTRRRHGDRAPTAPSRDAHARAVASVRAPPRISGRARARRPSPRPRGARRRARGPARARLPAARARGRGKREAARAFAGELLARGAKDPDERATRAQHGSPSRPDVGHAERRARDAAARRRRGGRRGRRAHAVRGRAPRLRARARGHDERRGRQRAAQDARGAAGLRRPAAAHRPA